MKKNLVNQTQLSKYLDGITTRWIQMLEKRGIFKKTHGKYDLLSNNCSYIRFLKAREDSKTIEDVKKKHLESRTKKLEVETSRLQGDLVPKVALQEELARAAAACSQAFRNLPWKVVPILQKMPIGEDGQFDDRLAVQVIDVMLKSCWRHSLCQQPRPSTPTINYCDRELVSLGVVTPDGHGEIICKSSVHPFEKKVKASDLLAAGSFDDFWHGAGWLESQKRLRKKGE